MGYCLSLLRSFTWGVTFMSHTRPKWQRFPKFRYPADCGNPGSTANCDIAPQPVVVVQRKDPSSVVKVLYFLFNRV